MPQIANLVLKDRAATPVNHTFTPQGFPNGVATLVESTGVPLADKRLTIAVSKTTQGRRKVTLKVVVPVVQDQVINGITSPVIVRTGYADVAFSFDASSSEQERKDLVSFVYEALSSAQWTNDTLTKLQDVY